MHNLFKMYIHNNKININSKIIITNRIKTIFFDYYNYNNYSI